MKKSVYFIIAGLLALIGLTTYAVTAWLTDTDTTGPSIFTVGEVSFEWDGELINPDYIVPGQELIPVDGSNNPLPYTLTNGSNVDTELRVKIDIISNYPNDDTDATEQVLFTLGSSWGALTSGYYYYSVSGNPVIAGEGAQVIDVLTSIMLDGSKVGNDYANATFSITLTFEAKQADYVTWEQLGTANIDFSTGLATP